MLIKTEIKQNIMMSKLFQKNEGFKENLEIAQSSRQALYDMYTEACFWLFIKRLKEFSNQLTTVNVLERWR